MKNMAICSHVLIVYFVYSAHIFKHIFEKIHLRLGSFINSYFIEKKCDYTFFEFSVQEKLVF